MGWEIHFYEGKELKISKKVGWIIAAVVVLCLCVVLVVICINSKWKDKTANSNQTSAETAETNDTAELETEIEESLEASGSEDDASNQVASQAENEEASQSQNTENDNAVSAEETEIPEESEEVIPQQPGKNLPKVKGIYVTGPSAGSARMQTLTDLVINTELNTMVIDVKNDDGVITYNMDLQQVQEMGACVKYVTDMRGLIQSLHDQGIYVIARIVCFKDPILAKNKPELALCKPGGKPVTDANGLAWVNPCKEEVWSYLCEVAKKATEDGFDEIQFDYVRFPIGKDANEADYGVDIDTVTRQKVLTDFFTYLETTLHEENIVFGADLFGTVIGSTIDRERTGQDYRTIAEKADSVCPMVYPSHYAAGTFGLAVPDANPYETIVGAMDLSRQELAGKDDAGPVNGTVRPWLQCFTATWIQGHITYDSDAVVKQIQAVYDAGYDEWILWHAANRYDQVEEALQKLRETTESASEADGQNN